MPLKVLSFLAAILLLSLAYAIVTQLRRSLIKRRIPYELMLAEKAGVLFISALIITLIPTSQFDTFTQSTFIVSFIILSLSPLLLLVKYGHRRCYVKIKRLMRRFL
jgi:uncharacterized membrane protein YesL